MTSDRAGGVGRRRWAAAALAALLAAPGAGPGGVRERLLEIYAGDMAGYAIYRDAGRAERVELRKEPVYVWTNPTRAGGQDGAVFVWVCRGRAEAVGTVFSFPGRGKRGVAHEFHSLATTVLDVSRPEVGSNPARSWAPKVPGVTPARFPDAPAPERTPAQRLAQMRALTRAFSGTTQDQQGRRWELRLLPQPLYRYESTDPEVVDGAVFAFVTSAGTDPEALLVLEARTPAGGGAPAWHYAAARYTDMALRMRLKGAEVLSVPFLSGTAPADRYRVLEDRIIPPVEGGGSGGAAGSAR